MVGFEVETLKDLRHVNYGIPKGGVVQGGGY